ncbi:iron ABC transporter permease [Pseudomonas luteola]|uniref:lipocalin-like domain-containing protein n=1 Tax=Pseudomonas luteola TaxID=47886 RepID=UPI000F7852B4|nr:lipocalin-like domain-containing protein [Pseudomonas luteola]RRW39600.1 iron ABC transporter permease [Pseudomonas luteola]
MNARIGCLVVGLFVLGGCDDSSSKGQGFAGLGQESKGFAQVVPGKVFSFPADHGAHPDFRIEWWYVTANLKDAAGNDYGVQWTLFRSAMRPAADQPGWGNGNLWLGHAGLTTRTQQFHAQTQARGGVGQAGVTAEPFAAWIDDWSMQGEASSDLKVQARGDTFSYQLQLTSDQPLVLQGDQGLSRKSARGQASYYYSQPFFRAQGVLKIEGKPVAVSGTAWLDREWSSQPLSEDQHGWDWFSLHLQDGRQLMVFRLRQADGDNYLSGTWIKADGQTEPLQRDEIELKALDEHLIAGRKIPTRWSLSLIKRGLNIEVSAINPNAWMDLGTPYWEGPVRVQGSETGIGYLEMTGY